MSDLHIPNLTIKNFRGIDELEIPRLDRVTLLVGKNNVGKTTVLDAVRTFAARGQLTTLSNLLVSRDELRVVQYDDDGALEPDWSSLFFEGDLTRRISISARRGVSNDVVEIEAGSSERDLRQTVLTDFCGQFDELWITSAGRPRRLSLSTTGITQSRSRSASLDRTPTTLKYQWIGPEGLGNRQLAHYWDLAIANGEDVQATEALEVLFDGQDMRIMVIGDELLGRSRYARRPMLSFDPDTPPVPLRRLGEGAVRLYGIALGLVTTKNGTLLLDEIANGLHYTVLPALWEMIFRSARQYNIQIIATSHSWDCVHGFATAARKDEEANVSVMRLTRKTGNLRPVEYTSDDLDIIAEQQLDVR